LPTTGDLHAAVNDPVALRGLIAAGADVEARDDWDCTPLFHAVIAGNLESLDVLIQAGANVNAVAGEPGCTILASPPLNLAMQCRYLMDRVKYDPIVKRLEAAGASLGDAAVA
jgi:ankyrin repeat protein